MPTAAQSRSLDPEHEVAVLRADLSALIQAVSHDLRAPLRAVAGYSRLLAEDNSAELSEQGLSHLERIQGNATLMAELISGLLTLYRIDREAISWGPLDMTSLAVTAWQSIVADDSHYDVNVAPLPPADGDAVLIRMLWENLLSNAVKFSRGRSDVIEVGAVDTEHDDLVASYWVRDRGVGFDVEHATEIFTVFRRAHAARDYPGHGVGLALVKRIVEAHGGRVWAEAVPERGATFHFTLPAAQSTLPAAQSALPAAHSTLPAAGS